MKDSKLTIKKLSLEAFAPYGTFANMINPSTVKIGKEPVEFFRDMVQQDLGGASIASFSVCRVLPRPAVIDVTEYHTANGEVNLPLDGDVLMHVGPATPNGIVPLKQIEVFRVPKGTIISLKPGVWHHAPFSVTDKPVNTLVVLPERAYANDCSVYEIPKKDRLTFSE